MSTHTSSMSSSCPRMASSGRQISVEASLSMTLLELFFLKIQHTSLSNRSISKSYTSYRRIQQIIYYLSFPHFQTSIFYINTTSISPLSTLWSNMMKASLPMTLLELFFKKFISFSISISSRNQSFI